MASGKIKLNSEPKTGFGKWMVYTVIPQYSNNVQGLVYIGAALLIIIVGIRGLGTLASELAIIPSAILDHEGKLNANIVMMALFLEFFLLLILALVTFFTPEDISYHKDGQEEGGAASAHSSASVVNVPKGVSQDLKNELEQLKTVTDQQLKAIDDFVEKVNALNRKLTKVQLDSIKALQEMSQNITK
ncbi:MAG: hypothetical protein HUU43_00905 [Ignavibacteriaceae bacterium]|nr:hypothetical protein [Ignavibacteriaceae bacterium]NUM69377.1 hypothetical protein [Ignavibacteriaceae bacterium]